MIAISYRREDSLPVAGRLYDRLQAEFGQGNVFMDFASIQPGLDFREQIKGTIEKSKVLLAMIGPHWVGRRSNRSRRIDDPDDFVRVEIECALKSGIPVIPVLLNSTPMPTREALPPGIQDLAFRHALPLDSGLDFHQHADRLIGGINRVLGVEKPSQNKIEAEHELSGRTVRRRAAMWLTIAVSALLVLLLIVGGAYYRLRQRRPLTDKDTVLLGDFANSTGEERSVAVLPLVDLSKDKDQEYLCDGLSEELIDTLSKIPGLRVAARTSAFSFKGKNLAVSEIARQLGVTNIIEGSLRRSGERIRVTTQLINAQTGFQLWSDTFERELRDVFAVQDEITRAIVDALKVNLSGAASLRKAGGDAAANDLYFQGLYLSNKSGEQDLRKGLECFQRVLDKDATFGRAWTGVAKIWVYLADAYVKPLDAYPLAEAAAKKALALDDRDAEAHCYLGVARQILNWDSATFAAESRRAIEVDPNSALAHVWFGDSFRPLGDFEKAIAEYRIAMRLDPLSPIPSNSLAEGYMFAGRLDEAIAQAKRTLDLDPTFAYLDSTLANAYREKGMYDDAIALYRQAEQFTQAPSRGLGVTYARAGRRAEAEEVLRRFVERRNRQYISAGAIGIVCGALGKKDEAFRWLETAYNEHDAVLTTIAYYPGSQELRDDPRFVDLIRRVGLDPAKAILRRH